ncbi:MAG: hypothetical protein ACI85O_001239 [Saprospiraceae bacterium]|jgi:hypothetical protein
MRLFIFVILFLLCDCLEAQTFNKRFDLSSPSSLFGSVIATDSMYYLTGTKIDSLPPYRPHGFFAGIDLTGAMTLLNFERDSLYNQYRGWPYLHENGNDFLVSGLSSEGSGYSLLTKINSLGETLWEKQFESYYADEDEYFIATTDITIDNQNFIYLLNNVSSPLPKNRHTLIKTDNSGNLIWYKLYGQPDESTSGCVVMPTSDGNLWLASITIDNSQSLSLFEYQNSLSKVDTSGNTLWNFTTPLSQGQIGRIGGLVEAEDGGLIINALYGYENQDGWPRYMEWEKYIYKISSEGELVWELEIPAPWLNGSTAAWRMIKVADNSGYVAVARDLLYDGGEDSISQRGWIGKVDDDGNLLWGRSYVGVDSYNDFQMLYDVKETADGGFVAVGWSEDDNADTLARQAWIIKTDEHGCLVPGCNLTATDEPETTQISLSLYPNPSSDILNIWYESADFNPRQPPQFQVTDMQGRIWRRFSTDVNQVTLMLSVRDLPVGSYLLTCSERREALPFVVLR